MKLIELNKTVQFLHLELDSPPSDDELFQPTPQLKLVRS